MGNKQTLSQTEINELCTQTSFSPAEVKRIYKRFTKLDFFKRGYVTVNDLMTIPDIDKNPLGERICKIFTMEQGAAGGSANFDKNMIDFKEFVRVLSVFNSQGGASAIKDPRAGEEEKAKMLFRIYDIDGDGLISQDELKAVLKQLVNTSLSDAQLQQIVEKTILDLDGDGDGKINFQEFKLILGVN